MWHTRLSKLASFFTHKNHSTSNQKPSFSNLWGFKSPPSFSKYGYKGLLHSVTHYNKYGGTKILEFQASVVFIAGALILLYTETTEIIPYTKRTHNMFVPREIDKILGERLFDKDELMLLSEEHPDSVRVKMIGEQIVAALESDLRAMKSENVSVAHLRELDWEFVVADMPIVNAACLPGKIIVYRGFLQQIKSDAEIATVIAHEVGHIVARHRVNSFYQVRASLPCKKFSRLTLKPKQKEVEVDRNPNGVHKSANPVHS